MKRLNRGLKGLMLSGLLLLSCYLFVLPSVGYCAEKTYTITESQLTQLESNLTELKRQNQILKDELTKANSQLTTSKQDLANLKNQLASSKASIETLTNSLQKANQSLNKLEVNKTNYGVGFGVGSGGLAVTGDVKNTWVFIDKDSVAIGYKLKF